MLCYVTLILDLILLLMIEDMCCLCELCFDVRKLVIWIVWIVVFLDNKFMIQETVLE
jgi:hypothetical protein